MLSFIPRILSFVFAPSPIVVHVSPSSSPLLFNDDKLALPLPSSSSSISALDHLRYVQTKFHIEAPTILSDEKRTNKSLTVVVQERKKESARGGRKVVDAGRRELGSSSIPSGIEAAASKPLRDQKLQDKVDELLKLSRFEDEEEDEIEETRRRERSRLGDFKRELSRQAALKGIRWQEQRRVVEQMMIDSRFDLGEEEEQEAEEFQLAFVEEEAHDEEEEVKPVEVDEERLELAKVVIANAACAGYAWRREMAEKSLHRADTLSILTGKPHHATGSKIVEDRRLYNSLADV